MMVSLKANKWSNVTTDVVQLIRDKIEDFRHANPTELVDGSDVIDGVARSWHFENTGTPNLVQLTVLLAWTDEREQPQACTTFTYLQL
jgi:hypothetical protein